MPNTYLNGAVTLLPTGWYSAGFPLDLQAKVDAEGAMERLLPEMILKNEINVLITHPGYVDAELLDISSSDAPARGKRRRTDLLQQSGLELTSLFCGYKGEPNAVPHGASRKRLGSWRLRRRLACWTRPTPPPSRSLADHQRRHAPAR
jgi:hypothetical protein